MNIRLGRVPVRLLLAAAFAVLAVLAAPNSALATSGAADRGERGTGLFGVSSVTLCIRQR
jgi:hypothetical protein